MDEMDKKVTKGEEYLCPSCSGQLTFNPLESKLYCEYCGYSEEVVGETSTVEYDFDDASDDNSWKDEAKIFKCSSCDAENVVSIKEICYTCPFCGSNQVTEVDELPGIKPHRVLSFTISKDNASNSYIKKIKRNIFVPSKVKKMKIDVTLTGVYLPVWAFDTDTESRYSGRLGKTYVTHVGSGKNRRTVVRTRWYPISGNQDCTFDDLLVNAGSKVSSKELTSLEPFDTNNSYLYNQKYLAGFVAEHYTLKLDTAWGNAKIKVDKAIKQKILSHYVYDKIGYLNVSSVYKNLQYKYVLVPVWIGVFKHNNKNYRFIVNGTNDKKIVASLPMSALKITLFVLGMIGIFALIFLLLILFGE